MNVRRVFNFPWRSRRRIADDVERELAFHIQSRAQTLVAAGMSPDDAQRHALREFGDLEDARDFMTRIDREIESSHRRREHMQDLWRDVKYALRRIRSAPVFTATAIATLAIGIGANTAVFSVVDAAFLRPLPYPNADRVMAAFSITPSGPFSVSPPDFTDWRAQTHSFEAMAAIEAFPRTVTGLGEPRSTPAANVSPDFFRVLGVAPILGRFFTEEEYRYDNRSFLLLSHAFWQRSFAGDPAVLGKLVELDGVGYVVVGVMPPGFSYPGRTELWAPLAFSEKQLTTLRGAHWLSVIALLKRDVTRATADTDLRAIATRLAAEYPNTNKNYSAGLEALRDSLIGSAPARALVVLFGAVGLVALIACANVANLVLARGTSQQRELAVRMALGASSRDLVYMALTESVLLALVGGALGLLLARTMAGALDALRPEVLRTVGELQLDAIAAGFTFVLSLVAGVLFGLAPAVQAARRVSLQPALQGGGRADLGERQTHRLRSTLVSAELALAVVLLCAAGLLLKSFARLHRVDAGFDARNMLTFAVSLPDARYTTSERLRGAMDEIVRRTASMPGAQGVGAMSLLPLGGGSYSISTRSLDGQAIPEPDQPSTQVRIITPGTLRTLAITLERGRDFAESDRLGAEPVVVVNRAAARLLWKDADPIGHTIKIGTRFTDDTARAGGRVVGIVADIRDASLAKPPSPTLYLPHGQAPINDMNVVIGVAEGVEPLSLLRGVRAQLAAVDPLLPIVDPRSMDDVVAVSVAQPRFATQLMSIFAGLAVVLAAIGVFGVMAYIVGERAREIGIRMALGASQNRVVAETLRRAAPPMIAGVTLGIVGTALAMQLLTKLLYDVNARDPVVLGSVAFGLAAIALLAAYLPARRASSIDPLVAVRGD